MPRITLVEFDGTEHVVEAAVGATLMEVARDSGFPGIVAECGGACACATCQVYIDPEWLDLTGLVSTGEAEMLEYAADVQPTSRLSCQIRISDVLDGMRVTTPESQL